MKKILIITLVSFLGTMPLFLLGITPRLGLALAQNPVATEQNASMIETAQPETFQSYRATSVSTKTIVFSKP
ncbi:hypothetical protein [Shinella sp.]|uniref:hypothetical protein n=1 Tax=Shinella sp. TaxID=1870904 RepID=UPI0039E51C4A